MTTAMKLAAFIERGLQMTGVEENRLSFIDKDDDGTYCACALGLALIGKYKDAENAYNAYKRERRATDQLPLETLQKLLGITPKMALAIDSAHCQGTPAARIVNDLRSVLYS